FHLYAARGARRRHRRNCSSLLIGTTVAHQRESQRQVKSQRSKVKSQKCAGRGWSTPPHRSFSRSHSENKSILREPETLLTFLSFPESLASATLSGCASLCTISTPGRPVRKLSA